MYQILKVKSLGESNTVLTCLQKYILNNCLGTIRSLWSNKMMYLAQWVLFLSLLPFSFYIHFCKYNTPQSSDKIQVNSVIQKVDWSTSRIGEEGTLVHWCGTANWCCHYGKCIEAPQKVMNGAAMWPATSLVGIHRKKTKTLMWKDICSPMLTAAWFTTKILKQSKCPSIDGCIRKRWYAHSGILLARKNEILPFMLQPTELPG